MNINFSWDRQDACRSFTQSAYGVDWRPADKSDLIDLTRHSNAEYLLRSWRPSDDPYGDEGPVASDELLVTVVFKNGCRAVRRYRHRIRDPLMQASHFAEDVISEFPKLAREAA